MKLTKIKRVLLGLVLLNTLVACKFQVDLEPLDSEGNPIVQELQIIDQPSEIIDHKYNSSNGELTLDLLTTSYHGELKGDLQMSHCTESLPSTCYANLVAYSQRVIAENSIGLPAVMVAASLVLNLDNLENVSSLVITDDAGKQTVVSLEESAEDRLYRHLIIESVSVDSARGEFTVNAKHSVCDIPGELELELDYINYTYNNDGAVPVANSGYQDVSHTSLRYDPAIPVERRAQLVYRVKGPQPGFACLAVVGHYTRVSKTFSFREAGIGYAGTLVISDATSNLTTVRYSNAPVSSLLQIVEISVDLQHSMLFVTTPYYIEGQIDMKPCLVVDPLPGSNLSSYQSCEADFVSISRDNILQEGAAISPALRVSQFSLNEVGLGQNNSTLVLNFQGGQATITIDRLGNANVKINRIDVVVN